MMKQALNLGGLPVADAGATETSGDRNKTNVQPLHFYYCIAFHHDEPDSRSMSHHHPVKFLPKQNKHDTADRPAHLRTVRAL